MTYMSYMTYMTYMSYMTYIVFKSYAISAATQVLNLDSLQVIWDLCIWDLPYDLYVIYDLHDLYVIYDLHMTYSHMGSLQPLRRSAAGLGFRA